MALTSKPEQSILFEAPRGCKPCPSCGGIGRLIGELFGNPQYRCQSCSFEFPQGSLI